MYDDPTFWDDYDVYNKHNMTPKEYIEYLDSYKNKEIEMPLNDNGYNLGELLEEVAPTMVSFVSYLTDNETGKSKNTMATGNIYDIDDNYIYIITCEHWIYANSSSDCYTFNYANCRFIDDTKATIYLENIYFDEHLDIVLIKIDKNSLSNETISLLRSINFKNAYDIVDDENTNNVLSKINLYSYKYEQHKYKRFAMYGLEYRPNRTKKGAFSIAATIENGCSGGGLFDIYGNYWGEVIKSSAVFPMHLYRIEELLLAANPNYFD